jgi:tRNA (cmo5U34)-methyltransferase
MTLRHLPPAREASIYQRIREALGPGGAYIEGDRVVSPQEEVVYRSAYEEAVGEVQASENGGYHIDVPQSLETQKRLLSEAGCRTVKVLWREAGNGVYVARS